MKFNFKLFTLLGIFLVYTNCSITTSYDYDKSVDFSQYKTFSIYQNGIDSLKLNDLDKNRIVRAIVGQLKSKGLTEAERGDLTVNVLASSKKVVNIDNDPYWGSPWGWGYGWGYGWNGSSTVYETREGKLTVHLVDTKKNVLVWEGIADGLNVSNVANKEEEIGKAMQKIFTYYPPKEKNKSYY
ncbi:DUF4136 domain-containing protein [Apibacter adventoris]|uniref:DUF4136 domain-containing protein n=1 Tax=Apibacter adventoris TaxID=1679466 RepID=A0A2S8AGA6_9FLAO|nr:DUF4136 domain-containing protein [Apibacter adventoris]PQL95296.1 DUF4136 domain-containing protein [Apibacter adventoris]